MERRIIFTCNLCDEVVPWGTVKKHCLRSCIPFISVSDISVSCILCGTVYCGNSYISHRICESISQPVLDNDSPSPVTKEFISKICHSKKNGLCIMPLELHILKKLQGRNNIPLNKKHFQGFLEALILNNIPEETMNRIYNLLVNENSINRAPDSVKADIEVVKEIFWKSQNKNAVIRPIKMEPVDEDRKQQKTYLKELNIDYTECRKNNEEIIQKEIETNERQPCQNADINNCILNVPKTSAVTCDVSKVKIEIEDPAVEAKEQNNISKKDVKKHSEIQNISKEGRDKPLVQSCVVNIVNDLYLMRKSPVSKKSTNVNDNIGLRNNSIDNDQCNNLMKKKIENAERKIKCADKENGSTNNGFQNLNNTNVTEFLSKRELFPNKFHRKCFENVLVSNKPTFSDYEKETANKENDEEYSECNFVTEKEILSQKANYEDLEYMKKDKRNGKSIEIECMTKDKRNGKSKEIECTKKDKKNGKSKEIESMTKDKKNGKSKEIECMTKDKKNGKSKEIECTKKDKKNSKSKEINDHSNKKKLSKLVVKVILEESDHPERIFKPKRTVEIKKYSKRKKCDFEENYIENDNTERKNKANNFSVDDVKERRKSNRLMKKSLLENQIRYINGIKESGDLSLNKNKKTELQCLIAKKKEIVKKFKKPKFYWKNEIIHYLLEMPGKTKISMNILYKQMIIRRKKLTRSFQNFESLLKKYPEFKIKDYFVKLRNAKKMLNKSKN